MTNAVYENGTSPEIAVGAAESIAVYTQGTANVYRVLGYPNVPDTKDLIGTVSNAQTVFGAYASGATIVIESTSPDKVQWAVGAAPTVGEILPSVHVTVSNLGAAVNGNDFYVTVANPNNQSGTSAYFDSTYTGATAGHCYGLGSWINAGAAVFSAGNIIVPFEGGVFTSGSNPNGRVVFAGQHQAILNDAPASLHAWRLNTTQTITAVIAAANAGSIGYTAGTGGGTAVGWIAIADIVGVGVVYAKVYSATA